MHWVVVPLVNSTTREPHSAQWMKSGMSSSTSAASSMPGLARCWASNWNSVLNCMNCKPVWAKISGARHPLEGLFHHPVGAGVTVGVRLAQHLIAPVEQHIVHTPGVRADGDDGLAVLLRRQGEAVLDFGPEPHDVPAERVAQVHRAVGEAVDFLQADGLAVPEAGHHAATLSADVDSEINPVGHYARSWWLCELIVDSRPAFIGRPAIAAVH